jgi:hypothetical protein
VSNLVHACKPNLKRFVLTTSAGVERYNKLPFSILNLFGESDWSALEGLGQGQGDLGGFLIVCRQPRCCHHIGWGLAGKCLGWATAGVL